VPPDPPDLADDLEEASADDLASGDEIEDALVTGELLGASVSRLRAAGCRFEGVRLTGSTFDEVLLEDVLFTECELSGVTLSAARLTRVRFEQCRMSGLTAAELVGEHVAFADCRLDDAWFRMADLDRVELADCDLQRADFYATKLRRSTIARCDLTEAQLAKAVVSDLHLEGSTLDGAEGIGDLRDVTLGRDQVVSFALAFLASFDIRVDDADD
jgi:uncharacterized protein YjbI with pentapeptide repeats